MPKPGRKIARKVIGIVGSRRRDDISELVRLEEILGKIWRHPDTLVSGGCPQGADRFAEILASQYAIPIKIHRAEWGKYGKAAGPIRNTLIAQDCDILIALPAPDRTGGTEDTIRKVLAMKKRVIYA